VTEYVLSIDPGLSTGVALLSFEEDSPAELVQGWQFGGGIQGLLNWTDAHMVLSAHDPDEDYDFVAIPDWPGWVRFRLIAEKFTARSTKGFAYTTASLEPLRCEGALIALGLMPDYTVAEKRWRDPSLQYFSGGSGKAERKKRQHSFLKDNGFYRTGKDFGTADVDDFRSAAAHGINYVARELKHRPTFDMIAAWGEEN
jgi:hypothetical protein